MSRRRRGRKKNNRDVTSAIPSRSLTKLHRDWVAPSPLRLVEDRRQYHPLEYFRPARTVSGHAAGPVTPKKSSSKRSSAFLAHGLKFPVAGRVAICVRRKQRKEVLHALKKVGRGRGHGRKRKNWFSKIGC